VSDQFASWSPSSLCAPAVRLAERKNMFLYSYVLSIGPDGCVTGPPVCQHDDLRYSSHFIDVDPTNRFVFVPCVAAVSLCRMFMHSYQSTDC
jgi:hypothetical protein